MTATGLELTITYFINEHSTMLLDGYKYHKLKIFLLLSALELKIAMLISIEQLNSKLTNNARRRSVVFINSFNLRYYLFYFYAFFLCRHNYGWVTEPPQAIACRCSAKKCFYKKTFLPESVFNKVEDTTLLKRDTGTSVFWLVY